MYRQLLCGKFPPVFHPVLRLSCEPFPPWAAGMSHATSGRYHCFHCKRELVGSPLTLDTLGKRCSEPCFFLGCKTNLCRVPVLWRFCPPWNFQRKCHESVTCCSHCSSLRFCSIVKTTSLIVMQQVERGCLPCTNCMVTVPQDKYLGLNITNRFLSWAVMKCLGSWWFTCEKFGLSRSLPFFRFFRWEQHNLTRTTIRIPDPARPTS